MKYQVTIGANIAKSFIVEADDEDQAIEKAHELFNPSFDGEPEKYRQDLLGIIKVKA